MFSVFGDLKSRIQLNQIGIAQHSRSHLTGSKQIFEGLTREGNSAHGFVLQNWRSPLGLRCAGFNFANWQMLASAQQFLIRTLEAIRWTQEGCTMREPKWLVLSVTEA
jgi:hypothetical protein